MSKNTNEWKRLYDEKGILVYEGFTKNNKPCGAGASYFTNGNVYQEGIFGVKGFLCGRSIIRTGHCALKVFIRLTQAMAPIIHDSDSFKPEMAPAPSKGNSMSTVAGLDIP